MGKVESGEIFIADRIERMLQREVFFDEKYKIIRDKNLIPKDQKVDHGKLPLFWGEGLTKREREIADVDALVLNLKTNTIELIIEYEQDTNPKNILGNFLIPFFADYHQLTSKNKTNIQVPYLLNKEITCIIVIVCLKRPRGKGNRDRAPLVKGRNLRTKAMKIKETISTTEMKIFDSEIIIGDNLDAIELDTFNIVKEWKKGAFNK